MYALDIWGGDSATKTVAPKLILHGFLLFLFHYTMLTGSVVEVWRKRSINTGPKMHFWIAFAFPPVVSLAVCLAFILLMQSTSLAEAVTHEMRFILYMLLFGLSFWIVLSIFGTMLPAATLGSATDFSAALKRSRKSFWFVCWRLLVGPVLYSLSVIAVLVSAIVLGLMPDIPSIPNSFADITIYNAVWYVALGFVMIFNNTLTAAILSMAYLRSEEGHNPQVMRRLRANSMGYDQAR